MDQSRYHEPVLLDESVKFLITRTNGKYVDCTLGGGGHFDAIATGLAADALLIGIDRDEDALAHMSGKAKSSPCRVIFEHARFSQLRSVLNKHSVEGVDGILLDLGVSSHQIDTPERGFSYRHSGPLDLRMSRSDRVDAIQLVRQSSEQELAKFFGAYGELKNVTRIARAVKRKSGNGELHSTDDLKAALVDEFGKQFSYKSLSKLFQALRIAVNYELTEIEQFLGSVLECLRPMGRLVAISYHSLEDRLIKRFIQENEKGCVCDPAIVVCRCGRNPRIRRLHKKTIRPSDSEVMRNPRARSARLRAVEVAG